MSKFEDWLEENKANEVYYSDDPSGGTTDDYCEGWVDGARESREFHLRETRGQRLDNESTISYLTKEFEALSLRLKGQTFCPNEAEKFLKLLTDIGQHVIMPGIQRDIK